MGNKSKTNSYQFHLFTKATDKLKSKTCCMVSYNVRLIFISMEKISSDMKTRLFAIKMA